eukprot:808200-Rhodomonas_salina.1
MQQTVMVGLNLRLPPDKISMPCSTQNVLILPEATTYGTATVTRVTSLITGLDHAPSALQAH